VVFVEQRDTPVPVVVAESDPLRIGEQHADLRRALRRHHVVGADRDGLAGVEMTGIHAPTPGAGRQYRSQVIL
jgi:hypothetical protein